MMTHMLKCWPEYYEPIVAGLKTFEVRRDDRGYQVGDRLRLCEWDPEAECFTGREHLSRVSYVLPLGPPLTEATYGDYCVMALVDGMEER